MTSFIKANAWSVGSAMEVGAFLDEANQGDCGVVYDEMNGGVLVQVSVIGHFFVGMYEIKRLLTEDGIQLTYRRPIGGGSWSIYYE